MTASKFISITPQMKDITGQRFGRLVAIGPVRRDSRKRVVWLLQCDCGNEISALSSNVIKGNTRSCGCLWREAMTTTGASRTPEYKAWAAMVDRCNNPANKSFSNYGGRGISACNRWHNFDNFLSDMGPRPSPDHTLDRVDNDKGYTPENCRWALWVTQQNNRRNNKTLTMDDVSRTLAQWSRITGIGEAALRSRVRRGWSDERALTTPVRK